MGIHPTGIRGGRRPSSASGTQSLAPGGSRGPRRRRRSIERNCSCVPWPRRPALPNRTGCEGCAGSAGWRRRAQSRSRPSGTSRPGRRRPGCGEWCWRRSRTSVAAWNCPKVCPSMMLSRRRAGSTRTSSACMSGRMREAAMTAKRCSRGMKGGRRLNPCLGRESREPLWNLFVS